MRIYLAEAIGTFMLVFVGAGAIIWGIPHFWIAFAFGAIVMLMILVFGKVSGAHINPAVSLAFYLIERKKEYLLYIPFQLLGALLASLLLLILLPSGGTHGETQSAGTVFQTIVIEVGITCFLMASILWVIRYRHLVLTSFIVGLAVFLAAYFAGPYTGASMNPARSFGPAVVSGQLLELWIYFLAPIAGASLAVVFFRKNNLTQ